MERLCHRDFALCLALEAPRNASHLQRALIWQYCVFQSEKLMNSVYFMPWECMNVRNQRSMCFLMNRIQTPIQVTAMGCVPVGVQTMQAVSYGKVT